MFHRSSDRTASTRIAPRAALTFFRASALSLALFSASGAFLGERVENGSAALYAQSIINNSSASSNRFDGFSTRSPEKVAMLDSRSLPNAGRKNEAVGSLVDAERFALDFPAPNAEPKQVDDTSYRIPFVFPKGAEQEKASRVELFCSDDLGATWAVYAVINAGDGKTAFRFDAPAPGEYWFVLKTYFLNGKIAYSSTRAYHFGKEEQESTLGSLTADNENFLLADDENELDDASSADSAPLPLAEAEDPSDDQLFIDETSADDELAQDSPQQEPKIIPYPGKFQTVTLGKEEGTDKLMAFVRWFKPEDLEPQYRVGIKTLRVETGPTADGPWTLVGKDLLPTANGYGWVLSAAEMEPFFIRIVAEGENGETKTEVSPSALDVRSVNLRAFLGRVVTPIPIPLQKDDGKDDKTETTTTVKKPDDDSSKVAHIDETSSSDEKEASTSDSNENVKDLEDLERKSKELKAPDTAENNKRKTVVPPKVRPVVPAPTDPAQIELNPLFTRGPGVLYRSAQTRHLPSNPGEKKRSIFTPPSKARAASLPPAEYRPSPAQLAEINAKKAQERMRQQSKYLQEHEMQMFDEKPELMEGRVFYMDSNGNMTTTPPAEFLQAQNNWQVTDVGEPMPVDGDQNLNYNGPGTTVTDASGGALYMPQNTDDYDASARSGSAIMQGGAASGSSPLNQRYSNGAQQSQPQQQPQNAPAQMVPNTSYSRSYTPSTIPYNYRQAPAPANNAFPPRPTVSY